MKVTGTGGLSQASGARPARGAGGGEGFRIAGAPAPQAPTAVSSAAGVGGVMGVEALLALQDVETATERKRRSVNRAGRLLDMDVKALRRRVDAARDALFARAGVPADGSWLPTPFSGGADLAS